jgi:hypothetical protein
MQGRRGANLARARPIDGRPAGDDGSIFAVAVTASLHRTIPSFEANSRFFHEFLTISSVFVTNFFQKYLKGLWGNGSSASQSSAVKPMANQARPPGRYRDRAPRSVSSVDHVQETYPPGCYATLMPKMDRSAQESMVSHIIHVKFTMRRKNFHAGFLCRLRLSHSLTGQCCSTFN